MTLRLTSVACGGRNAIVRGRVSPASNSFVACMPASAGRTNIAATPAASKALTSGRNIVCLLGLQYVAQRAEALHDHGPVVRVRRSLQVIHVGLRRGARLPEPLGYFAKATIRRREIGGERSGSHIRITGLRKMLGLRRLAFRRLEQRALALLARLEHALIRVAALLPVAQVA